MIRFIPVLVALAGLWIAIPAKGQEKPNILFLFVDDLGYHDLSANGSAIYQTPNIDALADQSVVFTQAYANFPRCVPSRYALVTGNYPLVNGETPDDGFTLNQVPKRKNLVRRLQKAGYHTAFFGKWHLGEGKTSPTHFGFDVSVAAGKAGSPISYFYPFNSPKGANLNVQKDPIVGLEGPFREGDYLTDVLTDQVVDYIRNRPDDQPFFAVLSFYAVHQPLEAKEEGIAANRKEIAAHDFGEQPEFVQEGTGRTKMRQDNATYAAMVENMDWNVGRLLALLEELGIADQTLVVFSSDNGGLSNDGTKKRNLATSNYPLRAGKGWLYEGGIRVPLLVKYEKAFPSRNDSLSTVLLMDLYPTLLELAGQKAVKGIDGESFLPVLRGEQVWDERTVYWHASVARPQNTGEGRSSAIRSGPWKLVDFYDEGRAELFYLPDDPSELHDLANTHPGKTAELLQLLRSWKTSRAVK